MKHNFLNEYKNLSGERGVGAARERSAAQQHGVRSRLSQGPTNPKHKTFLKNERAIMRAIGGAVAERNVSLRVSEVCQKSKVSAPTFYLHYRDCNDALRKHEEKMEEEFKRILPIGCSRAVAFDFLLIFIHRYRWYFEANLRNYNLYLLHKLMRVLWPVVIPPNVGARTSVIYIASVEALILFWCKQDRLAKGLIPHYAAEIMKIRLMRWV